MAFSVKLFNFSKKINSTATPTGGDDYECVIKQPCGVLNPSISLNLGLSSSPASYNYAYIPEFNRYYYVREWTFEKAMWTVSLEVDALASWRGSIGSSSCYVLRASNDFNGEIIDNMYPCLKTTVQEESSVSSPWATNISDGCFVIGVIGGKTTYYSVNSVSQLDDLLNFIFSDAYANGLVGSPWANVFPSLKAQCNPLQYISSIMWFPFKLPIGQGVAIPVGWVTTSTLGDEVTGDCLYKAMMGWTLRRHPQAATRGDYLNSAPYSDYMMFFPPFGTIHLDADEMANCSTINAEYEVDLKTGGATLTIRCGDSTSNANTHVISWTHSQVGVAFQLSQVINKGFGLGSLIAPAASTAIQAAMGNYAGAAITAAGAIGDAVASKIPTSTTIGSNGGHDSLYGSPQLRYQFKAVAGDDNEHKGRPLCEQRTISSLGGYIQVSNAYISTAATLQEKEKIIAFMEGGFYYE